MLVARRSTLPLWRGPVVSELLSQRAAPTPPPPKVCSSRAYAVNRPPPPPPPRVGTESTPPRPASPSHFDFIPETERSALRIKPLQRASYDPGTFVQIRRNEPHYRCEYFALGLQSFPRREPRAIRPPFLPKLITLNNSKRKWLGPLLEREAQGGERVLAPTDLERYAIPNEGEAVEPENVKFGTPAPDLFAPRPPSGSDSTSTTATSSQPPPSSMTPAMRSLQQRQQDVLEEAERNVLRVVTWVGKKRVDKRATTRNACRTRLVHALRFAVWGRPTTPPSATSSSSPTSDSGASSGPATSTKTEPGSPIPPILDARTEARRKQHEHQLLRWAQADRLFTLHPTGKAAYAKMGDLVVAIQNALDTMGRQQTQGSNHSGGSNNTRGGNNPRPSSSTRNHYPKRGQAHPSSGAPRRQRNM